MPWIKGIPVTLYEKTQTDEDAFHDPVYTEMPVTVENVLVTPADAAAIADEVQLNGHHLAYELCIPKGNAHSWDDVTVEFFGQKWHTYGGVQQYIEELVPLDWNKKVKVERYG